MKPFTIRLSDELHRELRILAAKEDTTMQKVITRLVEQEVKKAK